MDERSSDFRDTLQELIDASPESGEHPAADLWIAYHRGELPAEEEARLQEHLVRCRDCFELAEGAAAFARADEEPGADQDMESAAVWRLLQPRLDPAPSNVREIASGRRRWPARALLPLAASLLAALIGLTAWNLNLRSALEASRAPQPNTPILDFAPVEREATGPELTVPAGPRMFVFHPAEELPAYRLAVRDAATGRELSVHELRPDEDLALTLHFPEGLPPGRYRLEISVGTQALETHLLRVTAPDQGG